MIQLVSNFPVNEGFYNFYLQFGSVSWIPITITYEWCLVNGFIVRLSLEIIRF